MENNNTYNPGNDFDSWKDTFKNFFVPLPVMELDAIWVTERKLIVFCSETNEIKRKVRIIAGDMVLIENGELKDVVDYPTHKIVKCMGRHDSDLHFILEDTISGKELIVYI